MLPRSPAQVSLIRSRPQSAALLLTVLAAACDAAPTAVEPPINDPGAQSNIVSHQAAQSKIGPGVREAIQTDRQAAVMIAFDVQGQPGLNSRGPVNLGLLRRNIAAAQNGLKAKITNSEFRIGRQFDAVPAMSGMLVSEQGLDKIARHPSVIRVYLDLGGAGTLANSVPFIGADQRQALGNDGEGVVVAVLDTGADTDHPDLADDIGSLQACFGDNNSSIDGVGFCPNGSDRQTGAGAAEDDAGHGTHVSGIVSSAGTVSSPGVAPGANIIPIKVMDNCTFAGCFYAFSEIVAAWNYIINNNTSGANLGIQVINMSLGTGTRYAGNCDANFPAAAAAVATLRSIGITPFASSGNNSATTMGAPACLSQVVSVGATDNADNVAAFSNSNATTDIFGPGVGVVSLAIGGGTTPASGTSMASPHAAGCAALLIDAGDATTPNAIETRLETSAFQVTDAAGLTFPRIDCTPDVRGTIKINKTTVPAGRTGFTFTEDITATGNFGLDDGGSITFNDVIPGTYTVTENAPGSFFSLTALSCTDPTSDTSTDLSTRTATIAVAANETVECTFTNSDSPPAVSAGPASQSVQYSDGIQDITVTAMDSDQDVLTGATSFDKDGGGFSVGLPTGLTMTANGCTTSGDKQTCTWTIAGVAGVSAGTYTIRTTVTDDDGDTASADATVTVSPEDATVSFDGGNPVAVQVASPGGNSGMFTLTVHVEETEPDQPMASAAPGDLSNAVVSLDLVPVGPGGSSNGVCTPSGISGTGYDQVLTVVCSFDNVSVNTYTAQVTVDGGYYTGAGEDVLTVFDPSLGFTTGGGWFYWPGTMERTNFGYTMKYNKRGKNLIGNLLMIRHLPDGTKYRVKSNQLNGLALGDGGSFDWANFSGKATYLEPGWVDPVGNHRFTVYVEDHGRPGAGADRFWIEVRDKNSNVIAASSIPRSATANAETIQGGNIVIPHQTGNGGGNP
jgi:subtilisin family serine protease